jgi:hypothetical protein
VAGVPVIIGCKTPKTVSFGQYQGCGSKPVAAEVATFPGTRSPSECLTTEDSATSIPRAVGADEFKRLIEWSANIW